METEREFIELSKEGTKLAGSLETIASLIMMSMKHCPPFKVAVSTAIALRYPDNKEIREVMGSLTQEGLRELSNEKNNTDSSLN